MQKKCVISVCSYDGLLLGLSLQIPQTSDKKINLKSISKEYQLIASSSSIQTIDGNARLVALGGFEEVIRLFDVTKKKDLGSLMGSGSHVGSISSLQFFENKYLISAAEDSDILIWRCSDWNCLHRLQIMNKSPVLSMSMHPSGRILLALYGNGVLRLWNLMEARCQYKRKVGLLDENFQASENESEEDQEQEKEEDNAEIEKNFKDLSEFERKPIEVKWEPSEGKVFAILFNKMIEFYDLNKSNEIDQGEDKPCSRVILDFNATSFDFIGKQTIVISDQKSNLIIINNICDSENLKLHIAKTKFTRIKQIKSFFDRSNEQDQNEEQFSFLAAILIDKDGDGKLALWHCSTLKQWSNDLEEIKPQSLINCRMGRLTCLSLQGFQIKNNSNSKISSKIEQNIQNLDSKDDKKILGKRKKNSQDAENGNKKIKS